jgi:hypothetical protein
MPTATAASATAKETAACRWKAAVVAGTGELCPVLVMPGSVSRIRPVILRGTTGDDVKLIP